MVLAGRTDVTGPPADSDMYVSMANAVGAHYYARSRSAEPVRQGVTSEHLHRFAQENGHQKKRMLASLRGMNTHGSGVAQAIFGRALGSPKDGEGGNARRASVDVRSYGSAFAGAHGKTSEQLGQHRVSPQRRRAYDSAGEPTGADLVIYGREHESSAPLRGLVGEADLRFVGAMGKPSRDAGSRRDRQAAQVSRPRAPRRATASVAALRFRTERRYSRKPLSGALARDAPLVPPQRPPSVNNVPKESRAS